jgi:hypothetical protein
MDPEDMVSQSTSSFLRDIADCMATLPRLFLVCLLGVASILSSSAEEKDGAIRAFYIGHSLSSDIPSMVKGLVDSEGREKFSFRYQDIPGAPLRWQWEEKDRKSEFEPHFGGRYHIHLPSGDFNVMVVTDSVPRGGAEMEAETIDYLGRFVDFARKANPDVRIYYYETWHHLTSGTPQRSEHDKSSPTRDLIWRQRVDADKPMWQRIVDSVNREHPGRYPVKIIPSGQVLAAVFDAIEAGKIPGWTSMRDIFSDDIHTNLYGKYVVALSHYAVLTGRSPVGLSADIKDVWGNVYWDRKFWDGTVYPRMSPETVKAVQQIVAGVIPATEKE